MEILKKLKMAMAFQVDSNVTLWTFGINQILLQWPSPLPPWLRITFTSDSIDSFEVALLKRHDDKQGYTLD